MPTFTLDTSCMVPALAHTHPHHARAAAAVNRHLDAGDHMLVVAHTLLETYSVLTRLPPPQRMSPVTAQQAIAATFTAKASIVFLTSDQYVALLSELAGQDVRGGQVYDAAIAACARLGGADALLTFNSRHFERFAGDGLRIETP